ncbi:tRNA (cytosine(72)-C(5))-methyltransferase NSUN6-like isoform X2 [Oscarella lobularis]|uniref:tRNA (cytosine(72)-C(5))-methyltransferase NSUN6-like isoform X2 n=1 Tax=Oscarella lobularis TaxID=121494 RepID=UPI003313ED7F
MPPSFLVEDVATYIADVVSGKYVKALQHVSAVPPNQTVVRVNTLLATVSQVKSQLLASLAKGSVVTEAECIGDVLLIPGSGKRDVKAVPSQGAIVVDSKCGEAVCRGANVFAPGIVAMSPDVRQGDFVGVFVDVKSSCIRGQKVHESDLLGLHVVFLGNGRAEMSRRDIFIQTSAPRGLAVKMTDPLYLHASLNGVLPRLIFLQNLPSVVAGHVLDPKPGSCILDMCAAPGGKATHIATLMKDLGTVIAIDKTSNKITRVLNLAERLGIKCIKAFQADSRFLVQKDAKDSPDFAPPFRPESFDKIILDAPCSCLGQRPRFDCGPSLRELRSFPVLQKSLLKSAVQLLKPGGELVYCTCTISPEENESQVASFLREFATMKLVKQLPHIGGRGMEGYGLSEKECDMVQRFDVARDDLKRDASSSHDTIGFFIAKFRKG